MPRATRFPTGLQTGRDIGVPSLSTIGNVVQEVEVTVAAGDLDKQVQVPPNSFPLDMSVIVTNADASSQGINVRFGATGNDLRYGTVLTSAATSIFRISTVSGKAWKEGFGTDDQNVITVKATAAFALSGYEAIARITYIIKDV